jgi:MYXO-CTERM domain-containing protein
MRALVLMLALVASAAQAAWRSTSISATPKDVVTLDAGVCLVAAGVAGASVFGDAPDGGLSAGPILAGNFVSAARRSIVTGSCLVGMASNAQLTFDANCLGVTYVLSGAAGAGRLRTTPGGDVYAHAWTAGFQPRLFRLDGGTAATTALDWSSPTAVGLVNLFTPMSEVTMGAGEWLVVARDPGNPELMVYRNSGFSQAIGFGIVRDVTAFDLGGMGPGAVVVTDAGSLYFSADVSVPDGGFINVGLPIQPYTSVTFSGAQGSAFGRGFGMASVGSQIYSPVPNPNAIGKQWVLRSSDAGSPPALARVTCFDPSYCAAITAGAGQNVWTYSNAAPPGAPVLPVTVNAGSSVDYFLDAGDDDGDPVWVTWTSGAYWDGGDPRFISIIGPPVGSCLPATPAVAMLSDGYAPHDNPVTVAVTVAGLPGIAPPLVTPASVQLIAAGDAGQATATFSDAGCATPTGLSWSIFPDDAGLLSISGSTAVLTPPAFWCSKDAGTFTLTAVAVPGGLDASTSIPVTVEPWGNPNAPQFTPPRRSQVAGTTVAYGPDPSTAHFCASAAGFPGTSVNWSADAGTVAGISFSISAQASVQSSDLCADGPVSLTAYREVVGNGQRSANDSLVIDITHNWLPITSATPFDAGVAYDRFKSIAQGDFSVGANCANDRGLKATVVVSVKDGGEVGRSPPVPVPGPWLVGVDGGCTGGVFVVVATLATEDGGVGPSATTEFPADPIPARVPELATADVPVTCEAGAHGELTLTPGGNDCQAQQFRFVQTSGPKLLLESQQGASLSFATAAGDLQSQAGTDLSWSVTASVGAGNSQTATRSVHLVPAAFIEISHRTDLPVAREEESLGVEVRLTNTTACAVSGLVVREWLGGLKPIAGTVRLAGTPVDAAPVEGYLEIPDVALEAGATTTLSYVARVPLLASVRPSAEARFRGTNVTLGATGLDRTARGCGCASGEGEAFALLAGMLLLAVRSRPKKV